MKKEPMTMFMNKIILSLLFAAILLVGRAAADTTLFNPGDYGDQAVWGELNLWRPAGDGSVLASNSRIVSSVHYSNETHAFAIDFDNGGLTVDNNVTQNKLWSPLVGLPAGGVDTLEFAMRAPAGTKLQLILDGTGALDWSTDVLAQTVSNDWQLFQIPISSLSPALDLATSYSMQNFAFKLFGAGATGNGTAGLTGTVYLSSIKLVQSNPNARVLFSPSEFGDQAAWGVMNEWRPAGDGSVLAGNARIINTVHYIGETHAFAVDFDNGSLSVDNNLTQCQIWSPSVALPTSGVNALQFAMRAPAGTKMQLILDGTGTTDWSSAVLTQTVNNDWEVFYVSFSSMSPVFDLATATGDSIHNLHFKLFGAGNPGNGPAGLTGTMYLSSIKLVQYDPPSQATVVTAAAATITVDGNASDWSTTASTAIHMTNANPPGTDSPMQADLRFAWDLNYFYVLIQEGGTATTQNEAPGAAQYAVIGGSTGPWFYDGLSLWISLDVSSQSQAALYGFNPWLGFSSLGQTDLFCARVNQVIADSGTTLDTASLVGAAIATGGTFANHNRLIEARFKWSSLAGTVETTRQPAGGLLASIHAGTLIGVQPLMIQKDYSGQYFLNGTGGTAPSGWDAASRQVLLAGGPVVNAARAWTYLE
jgi:hypothetical protein